MCSVLFLILYMTIIDRFVNTFTTVVLPSAETVKICTITYFTLASASYMWFSLIDARIYAIRKSGGLKYNAKNNNYQFEKIDSDTYNVFSSDRLKEALLYPIMVFISIPFVFPLMCATFFGYY